MKRASGRTAPPAERVLSDPPLVVLLSFSCTGRGRGMERRGGREEGEGEVDFNKLVARGRPIPLKVS